MLLLLLMAFTNGLTFLHRANAIMVIRLPGTPTNMNTMHVAEANVNKPLGYPENSSSECVMVVPEHSGGIKSKK